MKVAYAMVADFAGYRVGTDGSVWSCWERRRKPTGYGGCCLRGKRWRRLRPWTKKRTGHKIATLYKDRRQHRRPVHVLVLEAFVGPRPAGLQACHKDGNPVNNTPKNLYWGTTEDNGRDRARHGRMPSGERHPRAVLTAAAVGRIKRRLAAGEGTSALAREHGVTPQCVFAIKRGKTWAKVTAQ